LVNRLLDRAYWWVGSQHGVPVQVWATWRYSAVLIDLGAAGAEILHLPLARSLVTLPLPAGPEVVVDQVHHAASYGNCSHLPYPRFYGLHDRMMLAEEGMRRRADHQALP
jgi:hypothetical protein